MIANVVYIIYWRRDIIAVRPLSRAIRILLFRLSVAPVYLLRSQLVSIYF